MGSGRPSFIIHMLLLLLSGSCIAPLALASALSSDNFEDMGARHADDNSLDLDLEFERSIRADLEERIAEARIDPAETIPDYLAKYDIPVAEEKVVTKDGYRLTIFHLPRENAPVIMFQHGIVSSAWCWIENEPRLSPAIVAWKMGYDVWLTNSRGNIYSEEHEVLNASKSRAFWDFSFADMGRYDVPANVEHILAATGKDSLTLIGHSQGTAQIFASLADPMTRQKLENRINLFIATSPVAYLNHSSSTMLRMMAAQHKLISDTAYLVWPHAFLNRYQTLGNFLARVSGGLVCEAGVIPICGRSQLDNRHALTNVSAHFPAGTSIKSLRHFAQLVESGEFRDFDYGEETNVQVYGCKSPPSFNLQHLADVPVALMIGSEDAIAQPADALRAAKEMNHTTTFVNVYEGFSHVTWIAGKEEAFQLWFNDTLNLLGMYNPVPNHAEKAKQAMEEATTPPTTTAAANTVATTAQTTVATSAKEVLGGAQTTLNSRTPATSTATTTRTTKPLLTTARTSTTPGGAGRHAVMNNAISIFMLLLVLRSLSLV